ncbi:MinD/ParA family ATP-binding protein [Candidatus Nitrotoga sp. M5]|uniref:MinD/ParA family ATP-binding protein n=1 Tax=Candidatus Nitrotoga sp. M5 TaxID=2890409 RepID=UPI001EF32283|nr:AAA family ATPase [Candidatus Nitrotoga sp. M5]CAH1385279.1 Flagellar synthesis regulator FleN [Candidatus Nitrotoga sp. M5]
MQLECVTDQAEGLRRLIVRASTRVITVTAARAGFGATSVVVNLATALARAGKDVLILDESQSHDNVSTMFALKSHHDLLHAVRRGKSMREIMLHDGPQNIRILPVARAIQALPTLCAQEREHLLESLAEVSCDVDVVLVDATTCRNSDVTGSFAPDQPLMLVMNSTASAITESYALIKRMAMQDGRLNFGIVVNKACNEQAARLIFGNVAKVARQHLQVCVEYLGYIPFDEKLKRATQLGRPVHDVFPAAQSTLAFGELGRNLMLLPATESEESEGLPNFMQRLIRQVSTLN